MAELKDSDIIWDDTPQISDEEIIWDEQQQVPERTVLGAAAEGFGNIPESGGRLVSDLAQVITNPGQTLDSMNDLLAGYLQKGVDFFNLENIGITTSEDDKRKYADLMNQYMIDRYGGADQILNTLATDPVGLAADVGGLLTGGAGLAPKAGTVGKVAAKAGAIGRAIDPIENVIKAAKAVKGAAQGAGRAGRSLMGVTTGGGTRAIERAVSGGEDFKKALRGEITQSDIVTQTQEALSKFRDKRRAKYVEQFDKIGASDQIIPLDPVRGSFDESLQRFGVTRTPEGLDFSRSVLDGDPKAMEAVSFIDNKLQMWGERPGDLTPAGLDTLKRNFDNYFAETNGARAVIADARANVRNLLNENVDGYAKMTADYQKATEFIQEIEKTFSANATPDTTMRKLNQAVKDNFEMRGALLDRIDAELGTSLVDMIAGNQLESWMAKNMVGRFAGMAGAGFLLGGGISKEVLATLFISSPKAVAATLRTLGVPKRAIKKFLADRPKLKKQFDAINKSLEQNKGLAKTGIRAAIPAVRMNQAYDQLIQQEMENGMR